MQVFRRGTDRTPQHMPQLQYSQHLKLSSRTCNMRGTTYAEMNSRPSYCIIGLKDVSKVLIIECSALARSEAV